MDAKTDFKRELDCYRARPREFRLLEVPPLTYLMLDGHGDPNTPEFAEAIEALYPVAYKLQFASKRELGRDFVVMPLEGLWSAADMGAFISRDKSAWDWTLVVMVPDWTTPEMVDAARGQAAAGGSARIADVRLETLAEGLCVQTLHVGPFDDEGELLARMHGEFIPGNGLEMTGRHHEIYLSDFRRTAPEKLRTILRQPVRRSSGTVQPSSATRTAPP